MCSEAGRGLPWPQALLSWGAELDTPKWPARVIRDAPQGLKPRPTLLAHGQFLECPYPSTSRTYLLGHRALPLGAVFFWTFPGNLGRLYLGWEDIQTALPKLPLSMVKASKTLHPGEKEWEPGCASERPWDAWPPVHLQSHQDTHG